MGMGRRVSAHCSVQPCLPAASMCEAAAGQELIRGEDGCCPVFLGEFWLCSGFGCVLCLLVLRGRVIGERERLQLLRHAPHYSKGARRVFWRLCMPAAVLAHLRVERRCRSALLARPEAGGTHARVEGLLSQLSRWPTCHELMFHVCWTQVLY
eukprot:scaffold278873_cov18-Tisochrysis_lutea.AAC.2